MLNKQKGINIMELFSGIGGFTKGFQDAGYKINNHYYSEIDKHAIANYKYNYPNAEYIGSVTNVRGERDQADIITFGSPCQDFSLAGKRKGMEGQRSSLIIEAIRLISEIRPSVFIWENVKGTFSSNNGADFWAILNAFTNIRGYRLEWQLLNTSWFLPQNRERIYLIGHLAGRSKPGVFPIGTENQYVNKKQSTQNKLASTICAGYGKIPTDGFYVKVKPVLTPDRKEKRQNGRRFKEDGEPSFTINCQDRHGVMIQKNYSKGNAQGLRVYETNGISSTLSSGGGGGLYEINDKIIRRLTEIECERLQGFPDNWTKFGNYDGVVKEISKTQRYKMLGNAVTTNVVKEIATKIKNNYNNRNEK